MRRWDDPYYGVDVMGTYTDCECPIHEKKTVQLPDGFTYFYYQCPDCARIEYPPEQAQALLDYSKEHIFMFIEDWVLVWMTISEGTEHVSTLDDNMIKEAVVRMIQGFADEHNISSEILEDVHRCDTSMKRIERAIDALCLCGYLSPVDGERFSLTDGGIKAGKRLLSKFDPRTLDDLIQMKHRIQSRRIKRSEDN